MIGGLKVKIWILLASASAIGLLVLGLPEANAQDVKSI